MATTVLRFRQGIWAIHQSSVFCTSEWFCKIVLWPTRGLSPDRQWMMCWSQILERGYLGCVWENWDLQTQLGIWNQLISWFEYDKEFELEMSSFQMFIWLWNTVFTQCQSTTHDMLMIHSSAGVGQGGEKKHVITHIGLQGWSVKLTTGVRRREKHASSAPGSRRLLHCRNWKVLSRLSEAASSTRIKSLFTEILLLMKGSSISLERFGVSWEGFKFEQTAQVHMNLNHNMDLNMTHSLGEDTSGRYSLKDIIKSQILSCNILLDIQYMMAVLSCPLFLPVEMIIVIE